MSRRLTDEDRILWDIVARTVDPLPGRRAEPEPAPLQTEKPVAPPAASPPASAAPKPPAASVAPAGIDAPTRRKLAKGRLPLEGRVDLHGLSQGEAHALLLSFLHRAHADGRRHVLVITGKGSSMGSDGILRRAVPAWLATPPFRTLVGGHEDAARGHGGSGALYVRLRRRGGAAG